MISKVIQKKIDSGNVIYYRRVSTKEQAKTDFKNQLKDVKSGYPEFSINRSTFMDVKEVRSARITNEIERAPELRKVLRALIRNPNAIILVSKFNRISRRSDTFELIQRQGLGSRIYAASSGLTLDEMMECGHHIEIEQQSDKEHRARLRGMERYMANGGELGSSDISKHSRSASKKKTKAANEISDQVLSVVTWMVKVNRGKKPSLSQIADQLNSLEICTGQGREWTAERLSQLKKKSPAKWNKAFDSYGWWWRRIKRLIDFNLIERRYSRNRRRIMRCLGCGVFKAPAYAELAQPIRSWMGTLGHRSIKKTWKVSSTDGCRGPPQGEPGPSWCPTNRQRLRHTGIG